MSKKDVESLNREILLDIQIMKDYDNEKIINKVKSILKINGNNKKLDFDNNNEIYIEYWLKQICNLLFDCKNTIYEVEYDGRKYIINSGSNFIDYEKYTRIEECSFYKFRDYYKFLINHYSYFDTVDVLSEILKYYENDLKLSLWEKKENFMKLQKFIKPIANYFPIGYNKNGKRIMIVEKLDNIKYNKEFIEHWKPISRKIIYDEILKVKDPNTETSIDYNIEILSETRKSESESTALLPFGSNLSEMKGGFLKNKSELSTQRILKTMDKNKSIFDSAIQDRKSSRKNKKIREQQRLSMSYLNKNSQRKSLKSIKTKEKSINKNKEDVLTIDNYRTMWDNLLNGEFTKEIFRS